MRTKILLLIWMLSTITADVMAYIAKPSKLTPTITWEITDNGVLRIYGTGEMPDFESGKLKYWLKKDIFPKINRIDIGEGITKVGRNAFNCKTYRPEVYIPRESAFLPEISVHLPSTLKEIGDRAFRYVRMDNSRLPDGLVKLGYGSFYVVVFPNGTIIIPPSVEELQFHAFWDINSFNKEIVIEGTPKLNYGTFHDLQYKKVTFKDSAIDLTPLARDPQYNFEDGIKKVKDVTFFVPDATNVPKKFNELTAHYKIEKYWDPNVQDKPINTITVDEYISKRLDPWPVFIGLKKMPQLVKEEFAKNQIKSVMENWQKKGEFESTEEWNNRVNEKSYAELLAYQTELWNKKAEGAVKAYNDAALEYKKEYEDKRETLRKEFYQNLAKEASKEYKYDEYTLNSPYDADNQTYLIKTKWHGDILLKVPRDEAQGFKQNWSTIVSKMDFAFLPDSESSVGLSRIIFPYNGKEYSYDGKTQTAYKVEDPNYAFTPLEVAGLKIDDLAVADIPAPKSQGKLLTKQKQNDPQKGKSLMSDIDQDIPSGTIKRDKTFAFIIVNENYTRTDPVTFALNDGETMQKYCEKTLGIPAKNISYVADASLNDMRYQLKRISDICSAFGDEASVLVYYAGHGVPEEGSSDAYLLPVDGYAENVNTGLSLKELIDTLSELSASNVTLLLDACFSGTGREGKALYASRGVAMKPKLVAPKGNLVIFSASQGVESALPYKDKQHGLFTYFLLKKLKESKGQVILGDLVEYVTDNVKRTSVVEGKMQTPTVNASIEKSDWRETKL